MKILKSFATLMLSLFLLSNHKLSACVFTDYRNVYIFGINLLSSPQYANYFYNSPYAEDVCFPGNEKNIEEWQKLFPSIKNLEFFHEFIYKTELKQIQKVYDALNGGINPLPNNDFVKLLIANKDKETLQYLLFAKKCEALVTQRFGWEYEDKKEKEGVNMSEQKQVEILLEDGSEFSKNSKNSFLIQRYVFQVIRLAYYHDTPERVANLFDNMTANSEKNYIYYRTLLHKGFALKKDKKNSEANLIFAEVFTNSPDLRCMAFKNMAIYQKNSVYMGIDENIWAETLNKATNPDLKAALYLLRASSEYKFNPSFVQNSFESGATVEQLEIMLLRQLKIAETEYFLPSLQQTVALDSAALTFGDAVTTETIAESQGFFTKIWKSIISFFKNIFSSNKTDSKKTKNLQVLTAQVYPSYSSTDSTTNSKTISENADLKALEKIAIDIAGKNKDKSAIFYLGAAYLQIMRGQYDIAKNAIENARNDVKPQLQNNKNITEQALYLETLVSVLQAKMIDENLENLVAQNTPKLWSNVQDLNNGWQRLLLFSELGRKYLRQGELSKAVLAFRYCKQYDVSGMLLDFYFNQSDLENHLEFIKGDGKTALNKLFWRELPKTDAEKTNFIKDLQATKLMREGKFVSALAKFKEIDANYWTNTVTNSSTKYEEFNPAKDAPATSWGVIMEGIREGNSENYYSFSDECTKISTNFSAATNQVALADTFPNKVKFLEKLIELETKAQAAKGDEAANIYIEMGNGMYHTHFWLYNGAIWGCGGMLESLRSSSPIHYPFNVSKEFATQFHNRKMHVVLTYCMPYLSSVYYKKAADVAISKNLKAQSLFLQGNTWGKSLASYWESGIKTDKSAFQLLLNNYADMPQAKLASACMVK